MKARKDLRASALKPPINIGDVVLVRQQRKNKFSTRYNPKPMVVTNAQGSMITAAWKDGASMTRNSSQFHAMPITPTSKVVDSDIPLDPPPDELVPATIHPNPVVTTPVPVPQPLVAPSTTTPESATRPKRTVKRTRRLIEEL